MSAWGFPSRDLCTLPLSPSQSAKLLKAGFRTVADLQDIGPVDLAREIGVSNEDALQILKLVKNEGAIDPSPSQSSDSDKLQGASAFELLQKESSINPIVTCNPDIDTMLGGGVTIGKVTEFCGVPGIGKTQMGIQLAVDANIPIEFDGADGECIYIDTEGSFIIERVIEIAEALVNHLQNMGNRSDEEKAIAEQVTVESVLKRIHYYRVHDYVEQIALVNVLPSILQELPKTRLIVIDSVTFHFRHDFEDMRVRTRLLNTMAQSLMGIAEKYQLAVVVMNQMTTKIGEHETNLVPALGESWGHACTNRVILYWKDGQRYAHLYKSPYKKAETVPYSVTPEGIR